MTDDLLTAVLQFIGEDEVLTDDEQEVLNIILGKE